MRKEAVSLDEETVVEWWSGDVGFITCPRIESSITKEFMVTPDTGYTIPQDIKRSI